MIGSMLRRVSPAFVGREAELAALDDAFAAAAEGRTTTVLIGGDAGVGKSRLLETWNKRAGARGARIAAGSCLDLGEAGPAYVAVNEALRQLFRGLASAAEQALVGSDRSILARIIPELGVNVAGAEPGLERTSLVQTRLFERLVDLLERAAADILVIIELEDIHWADRSSQAFVVYLVEVLRETKLLLIATYRPEVADSDPAFGAILNQLLRRPRMVSLSVAPFDEHELHEQLAGILGGPPSLALLAAIQARSEGNALFAEELAATADPTADLPASIGAAVAVRLNSLSADTRAALEVAAVIGRTADYALIREATGLEPSDVNH